MTTSRKIVIGLALSFLALSCDARRDEEKLQGDWRLREMEGSFTFDLHSWDKDDQETLTFDGDSFTFAMNQASPEVVRGTFGCDVSENPKQITFRFADRKIVGIYSLSGDELRLCVGKDDAVPPINFDGGPESRPAYIRYKRASK